MDRHFAAGLMLLLPRSRRCRLAQPHGGGATILVSDEIELLLTPLPRSLIDRLRGRVGVNVTHHAQGLAAPYAIASRPGRHPVHQMRELAHT